VLQKITRTAKDPVRLGRVIVVMMSGQGQTVRDITALLKVKGDPTACSAAHMLHGTAPNRCTTGFRR
jgi:hypothetical protein